MNRALGKLCDGRITRRLLLYQMNLVMLGIAIYTMCRHAHTSVQSRQMKQKTKLQNIA